MSEARTTCCVVGGGPSGMVLGLLLARAGIHVTVLEKHGDFLRDFRGDTVHASTLTLLDELGLGHAFSLLRQSWVDAMRFPLPDGTELPVADFRHIPGRHKHIAMVPQWDLLDLLAEAGKREPCFTLRMNTEVTGTIVEHGKVVGVTYRTAIGVGELRADVTVACDGRWSVLRRAAGLTLREYPVPVDTWWFRLPRRATDATTPLSARIHGSEMVITILRDDYYQLAYFPKKGEDERMRAQGVRRFRERVAALLPELADRVDAITSMDEVKFLDVRLNRLHRWYTDGLLCIGDAAHAMSPVGGIGINVAVQDAVATARLLAPGLRSRSVTTADLARIQRRRWLPTVLTQGVQRLMHAGMLGPVVGGKRAGFPQVPIWLVKHFPVLRRLPGYLIAIGPRPEHAPQFARRSS